MIRLNRPGFTVLELLLVIILVGVIAAGAYSRVEKERQNTRNKEREGDLRSLQFALEGYSAKNGVYPKVSELTNAEWTSANLKGIDEAALTDPKGAALNEAGGYNYASTAADGTSPCTEAATPCAKYTLTASLENKPALELQSFN